jgi:hypothetical protein
LEARQGPWQQFTVGNNQLRCTLIPLANWQLRMNGAAEVIQAAGLAADEDVRALLSAAHTTGTPVAVQRLAAKAAGNADFAAALTNESVRLALTPCIIRALDAHTHAQACSLLTQLLAPAAAGTAPQTEALLDNLRRDAVATLLRVLQRPVVVEPVKAALLRCCAQLLAIRHHRQQTLSSEEESALLQVRADTLLRRSKVQHVHKMLPST